MPFSALPAIGRRADVRGTEYVIVLIHLLCSIYGANEEMITCMVEKESSFNVNAEYRGHLGLAQFLPSTYEWLAGIAAQDGSFYHGNVLVGGPWDATASLSLMIWAIQNGYAEHWSTYEMCHEGHLEK